jgi:hypothetical protein
VASAAPHPAALPEVEREVLTVPAA